MNKKIKYANISTTLLNKKEYEVEKKKLSNVKAEVARLKVENEELKLEVLAQQTLINELEQKVRGY